MGNADPVVAVAAVALGVFLLFLVFFFFFVRLWIQALLTNTPVSIIDLVRMRLRGCPPQLIVHAMIDLTQHGVKVSAQEMEGYYLAAAARGERIATAGELADLVEDIKQNNPPQT